MIQNRDPSLNRRAKSKTGFARSTTDKLRPTRPLPPMTRPPARALVCVDPHTVRHSPLYLAALIALIRAIDRAVCGHGASCHHTVSRGRRTPVEFIMRHAALGRAPSLLGSLGSGTVSPGRTRAPVSSIMRHAALGRAPSLWITCGQKVNKLWITRLAPPALFAFRQVIPNLSPIYTRFSTTYPQAKRVVATGCGSATLLCRAA